MNRGPLFPRVDHSLNPGSSRYETLKTGDRRRGVNEFTRIGVVRLFLRGSEIQETRSMFRYRLRDPTSPLRLLVPESKR